MLSKTMRKKHYLILCGALIGLLASCTPTPTATPTPQAPAATTAKPTTTPQPSPAQTPAKTIELKFSTYTPGTHVVNQRVLGPFVSEVEKRTGGRVKVTMYPSETLGKAADQVEITKRRVADIAFINNSNHPGRFPLMSLTELPFLIPHHGPGGEAIWQMYKEGYFNMEVGEFEVLAVADSASMDMMTKKPVTNLADLKGMKIRLVGGPLGKAVSAAGASPVSMSSGEQYLALERGTVDGILTSPSGFISAKIPEIAKNYLQVGAGTAALFIIMNKDSWAKLPKDIQDIFIGLREEAVRWWIVAYDTEDISAKGELTKAGVQVRSISPADKATWVELSRPVWDEVIGAAAQKGLPAKATFDRLLKLLAQLGLS